MTHLTIALQTLLSMVFPRQEYWSGLPFPSPGDLPDPGFKAKSPALGGGFFTTEPPGMPLNVLPQSVWAAMKHYHNLVGGGALFKMSRCSFTHSPGGRASMSRVPARFGPGEGPLWDHRQPSSHCTHVTIPWSVRSCLAGGSVLVLPLTRALTPL